jgi:hypothetical protein
MKIDAVSPRIDRLYIRGAIFIEQIMVFVDDSVVITIRVDLRYFSVLLRSKIHKMPEIIADIQYKAITAR